MKNKLAKKEELVFVVRNKCVCSSLDLARNFEKKHKTILRSIDNLVAQNCATKNMFHERNYLDERGKEYRCFEMNRDGFTLLIMGFTGQKALDWKLKYIDCFNKMEAVLAEKQSLEWQQARAQGKLMRREETDVIKEFIEYAKKQGSKHADMYYIHFSKLANKIAGIHGNMRDLINARQLMYLSIAESTILKTVMRGMERNLEYKKIYEECKHRLDVLSDLAVIEKPVEQFKQERIEANVAV